MHCTKCGSAVPDGAAFCPGCGTPTGESRPANPGSVLSPPPPLAPATKSSGMKNGCIGVLALGVIVIVLVAIFGAESPSPRSALPPLSVTPSELLQAYEANEAAAQQQYGGRPLMVNGEVDKVTLDIANNPVVQLKVLSPFKSVHADLVEASRARSTSLRSGNSVTLLCQDIGEVIGIPMLKDCAIQ